ncbi:MAG: RlmI/RlmK family 23S rRNA methyltransferase [Alphaproteobacteria bacterium]|nr:RlmI/RlmK family 23S rRNA methyltransferase [Alphaproteobacteria bacterium]|tara:strand:+ start:320 stop:1528 length:1209 start_codon:yes stop_codon:yes gene_type:complete
MTALAVTVSDIPEVRLQAGRHKRARQGHPWVFSNEIEMDAMAKALPPGGLVRVIDASNRPLGIATFNPHPLIAARIFSRNPEAVVDRDFLVARLQAALAVREALYTVPYYRLVHAEADGLPGLIVDRFGDVCVAQVNTAGMEKLSDALTEAIQTVLSPATIVFRNDSAVRNLEGLAIETRFIGAELGGPIEVLENSGIFFADPREGQKTGWFYDQRDNRNFVAALAKDRRVADFYSYTGGFAVSSALAGAREVHAFDRSQSALDFATRAAAKNGVADRFSTTRGDAFQLLHGLAAENETFDIVVADPPAFVKSKKDYQTGIRGYRKLFRLAAQAVAPGGYLFAASCSHHVDAPSFTEAVRRALADAGRTGRILRSSGAAPDHPVHPFLPETGYLKGQMIQLD